MKIYLIIIYRAYKSWETEFTFFVLRLEFEISQFEIETSDLDFELSKLLFNHRN